MMGEVQSISNALPEDTFTVSEVQCVSSALTGAAKTYQNVS